MIADAMQKVGNEGVITVEEGQGLPRPSSTWSRACSSTAATSLPYFITNADKMVAELEDPYILIHEKKLSSLQAMLPVLEAVVSRPASRSSSSLRTSRARRWPRSW